MSILAADVMPSSTESRVSDLGRLTIAQLTQASQEETSRYQRGLSHRSEFGYEMMRRAICQSDPTAWEAIVSQYHGQVLGWIRRHPALASAREDEEYLVARTFERFWHAMQPERFGSFPELAMLLKYLKMCAYCVVLDEARSAAASATDLLPLSELAEAPEESFDVEALTVGQLAAGEIWSVVSEQLNGPSERLIVYLSFIQDLKPAQIQARHPDLYATVTDVYRIKRNVVDRLRRSPDVCRYLN